MQQFFAKFLYFFLITKKLQILEQKTVKIAKNKYQQKTKFYYIKINNLQNKNNVVEY